MSNEKYIISLNLTKFYPDFEYQTQDKTTKHLYKNPESLSARLGEKSFDTFPHFFVYFTMLADTGAKCPNKVANIILGLQ